MSSRRSVRTSVLSIQFVTENKDLCEMMRIDNERMKIILTYVVDSNSEHEEGNDLGDNQRDLDAESGEQCDGSRNREEDDDYTPETCTDQRQLTGIDGKEDRGLSD